MSRLQDLTPHTQLAVMATLLASLRKVRPGVGPVREQHAGGPPLMIWQPYSRCAAIPSEGTPRPALRPALELWQRRWLRACAGGSAQQHVPPFSSRQVPGDPSNLVPEEDSLVAALPELQPSPESPTNNEP